MSEEIRDQEKLLKKIMALLEMAKEGRGQTFQEAQNAAMLAAKLMDKYQIDTVTVNNFQSQQDNPLGKSDLNPTEYGLKLPANYLHKWQVMLAVTISSHLNCVCLTAPGYNIITFAGRKNNRTVAVYMYVFIFRAFQKEADRFMKNFKEGLLTRNIKLAGPDTKKYKEDFFLGACAGLDVQFSASRAEVVKQSSNPSTALVKLDLALQEAKDFVSDIPENKTKFEVDLRSRSVTLAGYDFGKAVKVNEGLASAQQTSNLVLPLSIERGAGN